MHPRIHDRYLLRQFIRILLYSVLAFTLIYVTVDIFEEIDNFLDHDASIQHIFMYYVFSVPFILTYIIPVSLLLGTVFAIGIMSRRNEVTALLAAGVSLIRIAAPIFVTSLLVSCGSAYFNDVVVAEANRHKDDIMKHDIEGRERLDPEMKEDFRFLGERGFVYLADTYNHKARTLYDVVVQEFGENTMVRRIDARRARYRGDGWLFENGFVRYFHEEDERIEPFDTLIVREIVETPQDFLEEEIDEENMTFSQLREHIEKVRRSGGRVDKYLVDLNFKFSFPFAGSIFVLIGVALSSGKRKQSIATGFGVTLIVSFLYYGILRIGQTLGHNGVLPPFLAAQMGNIIFLAVGTWLLVKANR